MKIGRQDKKEVITNLLKGYLLKDITLFLNFVIDKVMKNIDIKFALEEDQEEIYEVIEEEIEGKIDFSLETMFEQETLEIYKNVKEIYLTNKKLRKRDKIQIIADVLSDNALFEGICLSFPGDDSLLLSICDYLGCSEFYTELLSDEMFLLRKRYINLINDYTMSAINLYGAIHITDLELFIYHYEKALWDKDYNRNKGDYKNTLAFSPKYFGIFIFKDIIQNLIPQSRITFDGYVLHMIFEEDYNTEQETILKHLSSIKDEIKESDLDDAINQVENSSYRIFLNEISTKKMYFPRKRDVLLYKDDNYHEISNAEKQMRKYIEFKYLKDINLTAKKQEISRGKLLDKIMQEIYDAISVSDKLQVFEGMNTDDSLQSIFDVLDSYGINFDDINKANEILSYIMDVVNSTRKWYNKGYTPNEMIQQNPVNLENLRIVPGSTNAANILLDSMNELNELGFNIDLDSNAKNIQTMNFKDGINGKVTKGNKKVYPNDLCICGSGKKFKHCCSKKI